MATPAAADGAGGGGGGGTDGGGKKKKKGTAPGATPSLKDCANCGAAEGTVPGCPVHKPCSRCRITYYCSIKCQKRHWKVGGHKQHCVAKEDRSVEKATNNGDSASGGAAAEEEDGGDICAICQEALSESPSNKLPCSHVYHVACVEKLRSFDIQQVCPTCRVELPPGPQQLIEEAVRRYIVLNHRYSQGENKPWRKITNNQDRRENTEVVRMITDAAEQGHKIAQSLLANMHRDGQGVPQSDAMAVKWLCKASDQGYAPAQSILGNMYAQGKGGLPQSDAMAVEWWRKAADQGDAEAQYNLGVMHYEGKGGLPQNSRKALQWLRKAHAQGIEPAASVIRRVQQELRHEATAATASASTTTSASMPIGTRVELRGLKAKPELNGQRGVVVGLKAASGRCKVKLEDGRGPFSLKVENIFVERRPATERGLSRES